MPRDKHPMFPKTCLICRDKIIDQIKITSNSANYVQGNGNNGGMLQWRALCIESLCMLFGLPENHHFISIFMNNGKRNGQLCNRCFQDVSNVHHVFWQLQNLEEKLCGLQRRFFARLRINYDAMPVATVFATKNEEDIVHNLQDLQYDDIVKILFEKIKDAKSRWPQPLYTSRWKQAHTNATKVQFCAADQEPVILSQEAAVVSVKTEVNTSNTADTIIKDEMPTTSSEPSTSHYNLKSRSTKRPKSTRVKLETQNQFILPDDIAPLPSPPVIDSDDDDRNRPPAKKKQRFSKNQASKKSRKRKKQAPTNNRLLCVEDPAICKRTYSAKKHLLSHIRRFHKEMQFMCEHNGCSKRFESPEKLQSHKEKVHDKKRTTEMCEACGLELPRGELKKHYYMRHAGVGKFSCDVCSMDFNNADELAGHEQLHRDSEFPFGCVVCQNLFTNSMDLKSHVNSNHLSSGLKCSICGIMKHNDYLLQRHMKLHDRTERFLCHCGKSFASNAYLAYHEEHFHNNAGKKYPCEVCGKPFLHMKNVLRHMITHKEEKPFKCKICLKQFNYSHLLKKHEEIHSGTKNYGCEVCGKRFRQEQNLTQHMRSHRPKPEKQTTKKETSAKPKRTPAAGVEDASEPVPVIVEVEEVKVDDSLPVIVEVANGRVENTVPLVVEVNGSTANETVPIIVEIKGEDRTIKSSEIGELIIAEAVGGHPTGQFIETQGPQLISANSLPPHAAGTTVVFVTADSNFHWIA